MLLMGFSSLVWYLFPAFMAAFSHFLLSRVRTAKVFTYSQVMVVRGQALSQLQFHFKLTQYSPSVPHAPLVKLTIHFWTDCAQNRCPHQYREVIIIMSALLISPFTSPFLRHHSTANSITLGPSNFLFHRTSTLSHANTILATPVGTAQ